MTAKHTPGPWRRLSSETIDGPRGEWVATVHVLPVPPGSGANAGALRAEAIATSEANARLIAAAPELLEALRYVLDCAERGDLSDLQPVRAAIAAATGEGE